ncbi:MAG: S8 family serine peptidase [Pseudomonadota bacterium]
MPIPSLAKRAAVWLAQAAWVAAAVAAPPPGAGPVRASAPEALVTDRFVVKLRPTEAPARAGVPGASASRAAPGPAAGPATRWQQRTGLAWHRSHETAGGSVVYRTQGPVSLAQARALAARLADDPAVEWAEPDVRMRAHQVEPVPNDGAAVGSWSMRGDSLGGARLFRAWPLAGARTVRVAVLDTGSRPHPDLQGMELPGRDFVTSPDYEGDGTGGRDDDPTDPGDYCLAEGLPSSWHGVHVAGVIGAIANNGIGIAGGAAPVVALQHLRVLGRCGGWMSDIADAIDWASGAAAGNPTPAQVINLSLGGAPGVACGATLQAAIDRAVARGVVVVAAAGNAAASALPPPANCRGVIAVAAHTASGDLARYSNRAAGVALTGPGGGSCQAAGACDTRPILALGNSGVQEPGVPTYDSEFIGTSAAAPHVSAAAALVLATHPALTPQDVRSLLVSSARPHPPGSWCALHPGTCGTGLLDAEAALLRAGQAPTLRVSASSPVVAGGATVSLDVQAAQGAAPYRYHWAQLSGAPVALLGADSAQAAFAAPPVRGAPLVFEVTVASATGVEARDRVAVQVDHAPVVASVPSARLAPGAGWRQRLTVTDADGDPSTLLLLEAPPGARLEGDELVWQVPATPARATYTFAVAAADDLLTGPAVRFSVEVGEGAPGSTAAGPEPTTGQDPGAGGGAASGAGLAALAVCAALAAGRRRARPLCRQHGQAREHDEPAHPSDARRVRPQVHETVGPLLAAGLAAWVLRARKA